MHFLIRIAAIVLVALGTAYAANAMSEAENEAINTLGACYQAHEIHKLVGRMNEDDFVRAVMGDICREERQRAAALLADALASNGTARNKIPERVESFFLGHTTTLRMFYRRIKGAQ